MSIHLSPPVHHHSRRRYQVTVTSPMFPEGLISLILMLLIVGCAGFSVQQADWARIVVPVPAVAVGAALFGSVLAKLRVLDSLAHLSSILTGTTLAFLLVVARSPELGDSWRDRSTPLADLVLGWYLGREGIEGEQTYLVSILVGIIVWLVGYLAAWTLFRRGWILVSLLLPGFLILVNLGYAPDPDTRFLLAYGLVCIPLAARFHLYVREREWSRHHLAGPQALPTKFLLLGSLVAIIASTIGWRSPSSLSQETFQPIAGEISTQFLAAQDQATEWLRTQTGTQPIGGGDAGSYSSFDSAFSVGGPLRLSDTPQVVVFADNAPYLIAQRYDTYSGRGWSSTSDETFNNEGPDGKKYSPEMTFGADQPVPLSSNVTAGRATSTVIVTPLGLSRERLLTVDTFLMANVDTSVRMSWRQLDDTELSLADGAIDDLPSDLRPIANLLARADLTGDVGDAGPAAREPELQRQIDSERQQLFSRFLSVRWTADDSGSADTLYVTGQIPNYDDVDAVFGQATIEAGSAYKVSGSRYSVDRRDLGDAGTDYPLWVQDRYLGLPSSVTPRTIALASRLTENATNPIEKAQIIEQYLRTTTVYDESVAAPPPEADLVDYVLFERQRGYCEYYASAMAVMLRTIGIPARVVVGFFPGEYDQDQGGYLYRQTNAHAWVEVYVPGFGWIPFEPTASRPMIDVASDDSRDQSSLATPQPQETAVPNPSTPSTNLSRPPDADASRLPPTPERGAGGSTWTLPAIIGASSLVLLGGLGWLLWSLPLRGVSPSSALFLRLQRVGRFLGISPSKSETATEYAKSFAEAVPASREHVARIVKAYELDQFGPKPADNRLMSTAGQAWLSIRRQLPRWVIGRRLRRK